MNPAKPTEGWNQIMTLPRRLTLVERDMLGVEPAGDVASLRHNPRHVEDLDLPANQEVVLDGIRGNTMEILAEIEVNDAPMVELNVLRSPDREEFTRIAFFRERGYRDWERYAGWDKEKHRYARDSLVTIETSYSSRLPDVQSRAPETGPVFLKPDEPLRLRVFVDKSVVEVFVNGKQCLAVRVYPDREDSVGVSLRSQGKNARLISLDAWQMHTIYT
jgi:beta-fructofuranosidase